MNLAVIGPRVFIRPEKLPETTESGLLHLVHDRSSSTMKGTVVAVGDGPEQAKRAGDAALSLLAERFPEIERGIEEVKQSFTPEHVVSVGDYVLFSPDKGEELIFEKDVLVCLLEDDILAIIDAE